MGTRHLIISGQVQGVFYRATAKEVADRIGITGWVKNTDEGNVELIATGTEKQLNEFVDWCRKGPQKAVVENVNELNTDEKVFNEFKIVRGG